MKWSSVLCGLRQAGRQAHGCENHHALSWRFHLAVSDYKRLDTSMYFIVTNFHTEQDVLPSLLFQFVRRPKHLCPASRKGQTSGKGQTWYEFPQYLHYAQRFNDHGQLVNRSASTKNGSRKSSLHSFVDLHWNLSLTCTQQKLD